MFSGDNLVLAGTDAEDEASILSPRDAKSQLKKKKKKRKWEIHKIQNQIKQF